MPFFLELSKLLRYGISDKVYFSQSEIQISKDFMPTFNNFHIAFDVEQHLEPYNATSLWINHATLLIPRGNVGKGSQKGQQPISYVSLDTKYDLQLIHRC
jgi:hypothetical protein